MQAVCAQKLSGITFTGQTQITLQHSVRTGSEAHSTAALSRATPTPEAVSQFCQCVQ